MSNHVAYVAVGGEDKLLIYSMNPENGTLQPQGEVELDGAPGPLAVDPTQRFLYVGLRSTQQIASFRINSVDGGLSPTGDGASLDADPCYLTTDNTGRYLLSAYYGAGKVTVHAIGEDGAVGQQIDEHQTAQRAHCIQTDRSNRFVLVPHTAGPNLIFQFRFDETTGQLTPNEPAQVVPTPGEGPRHYVYHPSQDLVYFSNEQGSSMTAYHFDATSGTVAPFQTLPTLPDSFDGNNTCAQIHMHPSGRYLYVTNRGHDSIACFAVGDDGWLTALGQQPTEPTPRVFGLDPAGNYLYAAGQGSGLMAAYRVDQESGLLDRVATYEVGERPMWVMVLELDTHS